MMKMGERNHFVVVVITILRSVQAGQAHPALKEKVTHMEFYFHDRVAGKNVTAMEVASAPSSITLAMVFGEVFVMDDPLTEGPDPASKVVGKAQGIYASASLEEFHSLMVATYFLKGGKFNGSTLSVLANNPVANDVREMTIVGGNGKFRLARGYALAHTYSFDPITTNAIVHYNLTIYHY